MYRPRSIAEYGRGERLEQPESGDDQARWDRRVCVSWRAGRNLLVVAFDWVRGHPRQLPRPPPRWFLLPLRRPHRLRCPSRYQTVHTTLISCFPYA